MNTKLFKKLNEQMEINQSVDKPISESERNKVETELIFGDLTESINDNMNLCETPTNAEEDALADWENEKWRQQQEAQKDKAKANKKK